MFAVLANAHDFEVDGIYYNITYSANLTVEVTFQGDAYDEVSDEYTGEITIHTSVAYNEKTYTVTSIGDYAFYGCTGLTSVTIGSGVVSIGDYAFWNCTGLTSVTCQATMPPTCVTDVFEGVDTENCTLYVPEGTTSQYQEADQWKEFLNIKEDSTTGIGSLSSDATESTEVVSRYDISGRKVTGSHKGIVIERMGDGTTRKVFVK